MISSTSSKKEGGNNEGGMTHTRKKDDGRTLMCAWATRPPPRGSPPGGRDHILLKALFALYSMAFALWVPWEVSGQQDRSELRFNEPFICVSLSNGCCNDSAPSRLK